MEALAYPSRERLVQWEEGSPPGPGQTTVASQDEHTSTLAQRPGHLDGSANPSGWMQNMGVLSVYRQRPSPAFLLEMQDAQGVKVALVVHWAAPSLHQDRKRGFP